MLEVLVRGGQVVDGAGRGPVPADVGVAAGRVVAVAPPGTLAGAATEIDATGRYVLPGFVDAHSHADGAVFDPDVQLALLRQGVTTVVVGQDGVGYAPAPPPTRAYVDAYFGALNGPHPVAALPTVGELLAGYDGAVAVNVAALVPHGTVRHAVLDLADRPPDRDELARMRAAVERGLADGAVGLSTGLEYVPGRFADTAELTALCAPVAAAGAVYVSHLRGYEERTPAAVAEARAIAAGSGVAVHLSHYHGPAATLAPLVDSARAAGLDVTFDSYPYTRGCSLLAMVLMPPWVQEVGVAAACDRLADPAVRKALVEDWLPGVPARLGWDGAWADRITLAGVGSREYRWAEGLTLAAAAREAGIGGPAEFAAEVLAASRLAVSAVFAFPSATGEDDMRALLRHPAHLAGSDGIFAAGHPHPRAWGTFARLLGRHTRELGDYTWAEAAEHLAGRAAARYGLAGRGQVRVGYAADLVVVDPAAVADTATYDRPRSVATGVADVLVNGVPVVAGGALTGARPGRGLRRG
ncbi:MAG: amidohydrolase family protein [Mycobacteriales bacterium]